MAGNINLLMVAALGALALVGLATPSFAQQTGDDMLTLTVSGHGEISAAPDVAEINIGVVTQGRTAGDALRENSRAMSALQEELKRRGVAAKDIQTTRLNVSPRYSQPPRNPPGRQGGEPFVREIIGYDVNNTVNVTARDLDKLGELLDAVVSAGANQLNGISFRIEESQKLMDEARKRAMADAQRKAELLAGEVGMVLAKPIQIVEGGGSAPPPPRPMARGMMAAAEAVPVAAGEEELSVNVRVVYEMKRPE